MSAPSTFDSSLLPSMCHFPRTDARQRQARELRRAHDVLSDNIAFQVYAVANLKAAHIRVVHRVRHDLDAEAIGAELRNRQAAASHGDRSAMHDVLRQR